MKLSENRNNFIQKIFKEIQDRLISFFVGSAVAVVITSAIFYGVLRTLPDRVAALDSRVEQLEKYVEKQNEINQKLTLLEENNGLQVLRTDQKIDNLTNILISNISKN